MSIKLVQNSQKSPKRMKIGIICSQNQFKCLIPVSKIIIDIIPEGIIHMFSITNFFKANKYQDNEYRCSKVMQGYVLTVVLQLKQYKTHYQEEFVFYKLNPGSTIIDIYMNGLLNFVKDSNISMYADDTDFVF